ncbi:hypothetical protein [Ruegeria jejuensis]|uniref:hypothetical protein n=1 Tax=Ruegeria jejuensis TaxID=3233338 RepID=UPI00355BAE3A
MTDLDVKLKYVYRETLPSGNTRYRFEKAGRKVTLKGEPGSPEFLASYQAALNNLPKTDRAAKKGSITWLVGLFIRHLESQVAAGLISPLTLKGHKQLVSEHVV